METLKEIYLNLDSSKSGINIPNEIENYINIVGQHCQKRKGVYTVLVTLLYYKYLNPKQDIRLFQTRFKNGFSARSFDTEKVTPVLKELGLPAMAESGWLTRSLEQPYPYNFKYKGAIPTILKTPFLRVIDYVQNNPKSAYSCLVVLLKKVKEISSTNKVVIKPLLNPENLTISNIIICLQEQFYMIITHIMERNYQY